jgi:amino acid transporter
VMAALSLAIFWIVVGMNVRGLRYGRWLNNLGAYGTWIPAAVLIGLGGVALLRFGAATPFLVSGLAPAFGLATVNFFAQICFGFSGVDLASLMGEEIHDPRRNVPRAILISGVIITLIYVLGTAALLVTLPQEKIGILDGVAAAIGSVQSRMGFGVVANVSAVLIALGGVGGVSAWLAGCSRVPYVAGIDRYLPAAFGRLHPRYASPHVALLVTGALSSLLIVVGFIGVNVDEAYFFLADFTIVVYFIPYLYLFAALIKLGVPETAAAGTIPVPGGRPGAILVGALGFLTTAVAIVCAFIPPPGTRPIIFMVKIVGGCLALLFLGWLLYRRGRREA